MPQTETPSNVPVVSHVVRLRDRLVDRDLWGFQGQCLDADVIQEFACAACKAMPKVSKQTIFDSVSHLAGAILTEKILFDTAWLFAGNKKQLESGVPVHPWAAQKALEWVPVQVLSSERAPSPRNKAFGANYRLRILAGSACPLIIFKWWSFRFAQGLALRGGYTRNKNKYPFYDIAELVNLRFVAQLDPKRSREFPEFDNIGCTSGLLKWNRSIIQKRFRKDGKYPWPCPRNYTHPCFRCHVGYLECAAAVHKDTFERNGDGNSVSQERV